MEPVDLNAESKNTPSQSPDPEASAAFQGLAEIFANVKGPGPHRRYLLERIDGESVFRQTEVGAAIEAAIAALRHFATPPEQPVAGASLGCRDFRDDAL